MRSRLSDIAPRLRHMLLPGLAAAALFAGGNANATIYAQTNLVTDDQAALASLGFAPAAFVDPSLINPWGVSFAPGGPFWVSNQGTNTSTLYNGAGEPFPVGSPLIVNIPAAGPPAGPTGQVFNGTDDFVLPNGGPGRFFFANLDGSISGWNGAAGTDALVVIPPASGARPAIYTGLALANDGSGNLLYAANNLTGLIDVFDSSFAPVALPGGFDPGPNPDGLVPFNIQNIDGLLYVTYAIGGPEADEAPLGSGFVNVFNPDGSFVRRFTTGGNLASPWGLALAPDSFGEFANALLIGNFNDELGFINAFDATTGAFLGALRDVSNQPLVIPYLWALIFGNGGIGGDPEDLYFAAGIGDEEHGLFGEIAVPEPATAGLLSLGVAGLALRRRRKALARS